jgi:hypothetical protein
MGLSNLLLCSLQLRGEETEGTTHQRAETRVDRKTFNYRLNSKQFMEGLPPATLLTTCQKYHNLLKTKMLSKDSKLNITSEEVRIILEAAKSGKSPKNQR